MIKNARTTIDATETKADTLTDMESIDNGEISMDKKTDGGG
jgi:hypothetical protein